MICAECTAGGKVTVSRDLAVKLHDGCEAPGTCTCMHEVDVTFRNEERKYAISAGYEQSAEQRRAAPG